MSIKIKTYRVIKESKLQMEREYLWRSLANVLNKDIYKELFTLETTEEMYEYLRVLESIFIQYARGFSVPKYKILKSHAFNTLKTLTHSYYLKPSLIRLKITQLEECCRKKTKNAKLI
mgnify:CR=1 FL=1|tara:strand:+ start:302 stop:655 length:354 start_codon:yes stop_codon:yes gene_type:complete